MTRKNIRKKIQEELHKAFEEAGIEVRRSPCDPGWEITVKFQKLDEEVCGVESDPSYKVATFYFDPTQMGKMTDSWLREYVRHEVVHLLLSPLVRYAEHYATDEKAQTVLEDIHEDVTKSLTVLWCRLLGMLNEGD